MTWLLKASRLFQEKVENVINGIPILAQSVIHRMQTSNLDIDELIPDPPSQLHFVQALLIEREFAVLKNM